MPPYTPEPLPIDLDTCDVQLGRLAKEIRRCRHPSARVTATHRAVLARRFELLLEHRSRLVAREVRRLESWWRQSWPGISADQEVGL